MNPFRTLAPQQAAALDAFAGAVRRLVGERLMALKRFGSHARGEAAPESDLNVLVAVEETTPALENQILDLAMASAPTAPDFLNRTPTLPAATSRLRPTANAAYVQRVAVRPAAAQAG